MAGDVVNFKVSSPRWHGFANRALLCKSKKQYIFEIKSKNVINVF